MVASSYLDAKMLNDAALKLVAGSAHRQWEVHGTANQIVEGSQERNPAIH